MSQCKVVALLSRFVPCKNEVLLQTVLRLILNLSFDANIREELVSVVRRDARVQLVTSTRTNQQTTSASRRAKSIASTLFYEEFGCVWRRSVPRAIGRAVGLSVGLSVVVVVVVATVVVAVVGCCGGG